MRTDSERLDDILEAIGNIERRVPNSADEFLGNELLQVWVIHHLQTIGEAVRALSQSLRERHPEVPWTEIIALRNILVHEYFGLNLRQVWMAARKDLPKLKDHIQRIRT